MRVSSFRRAILCLLPLLCLVQEGGVAAAPETTALLGGLDLTVSVVQEDLGTVPCPAAGAESALETDTVTVDAGTNIGDLLRSRFIQPNGDALSVVYLLNPELRSIEGLEVGTSLVVPALSGDQAAPGALVQLSLVPQTKRELKMAAREIAASVSQVRELPMERVGKPGERAGVLAVLDEIVSYLGEVNSLVERGDVPLSPEMLDQSVDGALVVRGVLDQALRPGGRLGVAERQALIGVARDMNLKARNLDTIRGPGKSPRRWRDVQVVVAVVQLPGQAPVPGLRVFYAPEVLMDEPFAIRSFPELSPQVAKRLIEADYVFWAAPPGSSRPVTERLTQQIRRNPDDEIKLQLSVLPAREEM